MRAGIASALALLVLASSTTAFASSPGACPPQPLELRRAGFVRTSDGGAPPDEAAFATVDLPDDWRSRRPGEGGLAWYRLDLPELAVPTSSEGRCAVLLPDVNMNAAAFVNGQWIGEGGSMQEPVAHNFNRPLYFTFPASLLRGKGDRIDVLLYAYAHHFGRLGPVWLGPHSALAPEHAWAEFRQITLSHIGSAFALITSLFAIAIWAGSGFESLYGFFFLSTAAWAINSLNYWVRDIPLSHWAWDRLINGALDQFAVFLAFFFHRVVGGRRPLAERLLLAFSATAAILAIVTPRADFAPAMMLTHAMITGIGAYVTILSWTHRRRLAPIEAKIYLSAWAIQLLFSTNDLGIQLGLWRGLGYTLPFTVSCMMVAFGSTLALRVARALGEARLTSGELEERVRLREAEIQAHYDRVQKLERTEILRLERERLMREMHDGLGGHLVSSLALAESASSSRQHLVTALRDSIAELRLVILALDPELENLSALLAGLRDRLEPALEGRGIAFRWRVTDVPTPAGFGAEQLLSMLRIVQEAVSNAVQHSGARTIEIATVATDAHVSVTIRDDGQGFPEPLRAGRGLASMQRRATELNGELEVVSSSSGTTIEIRVPLST